MAVEPPRGDGRGVGRGVGSIAAGEESRWCGWKLRHVLGAAAKVDDGMPFGDKLCRCDGSVLFWSCLEVVGRYRRGSCTGLEVQRCKKWEEGRCLENFAKQMEGRATTILNGRSDCFVIARFVGGQLFFPSPLMFQLDAATD